MISRCKRATNTNLEAEEKRKRKGTKYSRPKREQTRSRVPVRAAEESLERRKVRVQGEPPKPAKRRKALSTLEVVWTVRTRKRIIAKVDIDQ